VDRDQGLFPDLPFVPTSHCFPYRPQPPGKDGQRDIEFDGEGSEERVAIFSRHEPGEIERSKCGQEAISGQDPRNQPQGPLKRVGSGLSTGRSCRISSLLPHCNQGKGSIFVGGAYVFSSPGAVPEQSGVAGPNILI